MMKKSEIDLIGILRKIIGIRKDNLQSCRHRFVGIIVAMAFPKKQYTVWSYFLS